MRFRVKIWVILTVEPFIYGRRVNFLLDVKIFRVVGFWCNITICAIYSVGNPAVDLFDEMTTVYF